MRRATASLVAASLLLSACAGATGHDPAVPTDTDRVMALVAEAEYGSGEPGGLPEDGPTDPSGPTGEPAPTDPSGQPDGPLPGAGADPEEIPEGCRVDVTIDEYGFETEVLRCGEEGAEEDPPAGDVESWLGTPASRNTARHIRNVVVLQNLCTDVGNAQLAALAKLVPSAPPEIRPHLDAAVRSLQRSGVACNHDDRRWRNRLNDALDSLEIVIDIIEESLSE